MGFRVKRDWGLGFGGTDVMHIHLGIPSEDTDLNVDIDMDI